MTQLYPARRFRVQGAFVWLTLIAALAARPALALETNLVISVYQGVCREGDFSANLATARQVIKQAQERGSQFIALPECFLSGYETREVVERGARSLDDAELKDFIAESAGHDMVVLVGMARKAGRALYNTELVIYRGKLLGFYDKIMLTDGDSGELGFTPGTSVPVFYAHGAHFAVIICHDSSFPHVAMAARLQGAEILFTPHYNEIGVNSVDDHRRWVRNCHVGLACQLKMVVARANVVKANRAGMVGYGDSFILTPQGTALAQADLFKDELISATITPALFQAPWVLADADEVPAWLRGQLSQMLTQFRRPANDSELRFWLENMVVYHRFNPGEVSAVTGLTLEESDAALRRLDLRGKAPPPRGSGEPLRVLPYPGGRHPRLGFLDGAIMPQRETKVSVFAPWDETGYVVVDVPEAIFSNLGLTYLAHTHIPTIWDARGMILPRLEWQRHNDGTLAVERTLPNGIAFGATIVPSPTEVQMELWLRNGTPEKLTGLRVQNCVMLAHAPGFAAQTGTNKLYQTPYAVARSDDSRRWIITAWDPIQRCWGNDQCPCLHADPQFPNCAPGETVRVRGWLSFYQGTNIKDELERIDATGWQRAGPPGR
jgi:predicted amidohydrolase